MVDDIISVTYVEQTKLMNEPIQIFILSKKLKLSETKCYQIHIGKGHKGCPTLKVHDTNMKQAKSDKYFDDVVDKTGSIQSTIENRKIKGQGTITEILVIINEIPLGVHRTDVAMKL